MKNNKKIYFASDFHLGVPNKTDSLHREKLIVKWLDEIKSSAHEIFLVGDIFDFWFEYKHVAPKGYIRLLGKIAELTDANIPVHIFTGNHDMWMFDYLPEQLGINLHREPIERVFNNKSFYIGHGDGLGPGDYGYKFIKKVFSNKFCQWLFARLHPNLGINLANFWSGKSRKKNIEQDKNFLGEEKEWLAIYAQDILRTKHYDFFVFGHRHLPMDISLNKTSKYINLGDWITHFTYAEFDGENLLLRKYNTQLK